jgi:hypothetical protein
MMGFSQKLIFIRPRDTRFLGKASPNSPTSPGRRCVGENRETSHRLNVALGEHMGIELPPTTWYTECPLCAGTAMGIKEIPRAEMGAALRSVADPADVRVLAHFLGDCRHVWGVIVYRDERREKYSGWTLRGAPPAGAVLRDIR